MTDWNEIYSQRTARAAFLAEHSGDIDSLDTFSDITVNEALVLGLIKQGVKKFFAVFGHGSTDLGEVLRVYQEHSLVRVYNFRSEISASHAAAMMRWKFGEYCAVVTSIGPGALQALSASLVGQSNGLGIYYLFGDETTGQEGPNMQQIPKREQDLYLKLADVMGKGFTIGDPYALAAALKRAWGTTRNPAGEKPFYILLPMNVQSRVMRGYNIRELPGPTIIPKQCCIDEYQFKQAAAVIQNSSRVTVKIGRGAAGVEPAVLKDLVRRCSAVLVHSPHIPGMLAYDDPLNMTVGGSKGSLCGNYAMEHCDTAIIIGARGVCQWDSSGTAWKEVKHVISINSSIEDVLHYNRTTALTGDAAEVVRKLSSLLCEPEETSPWQQDCIARRKSWDEIKQKVYRRERIFDEQWGREVLTQPAAIYTAIGFADAVSAVKIFDAGDVQANGFQAVEDSTSGMTVTDTGASYMGFAVSALAACGAAEKKEYGIAFTGDGSFFMNPQVLIDAVHLGVRAMVIIFDNRRMSAISNLQRAQYGTDFATSDSVLVDYAALADAVSGVRGFFGGTTAAEFRSTLKTAYEHSGLSVIHVPVYFGQDEDGGLGVFGSWNVGNWCEKVEAEKHRIGL